MQDSRPSPYEAQNIPDCDSQWTRRLEGRSGIVAVNSSLGIGVSPRIVACLSGNSNPGPYTPRLPHVRGSVIKAAASAVRPCAGAKSRDPLRMRAARGGLYFRQQGNAEPVPPHHFDVPSGSPRPRANSISSDVRTGTDHASASRSLSRYAAEFTRFAARRQRRPRHVRPLRARPVMGLHAEARGADFGWLSPSRAKTAVTSARDPGNRASGKADRDCRGRSPPCEDPSRVFVPPTSPASSIADDCTAASP